MEPQLSPFGHRLRDWRRQRGLSQLQLASLAETTPRHVSFIETGRSRPGRDLVLRLAECMHLPVRDRNELLALAGLPPAFAERELNEEELRPFRVAIEAMLRKHEPYPACAFDGLGRVRMANAPFRVLWPAAMEATPEEAIDTFFGPGPMREMIDNWAEVAWANIDSQRQRAARTNNPRLHSLLKRSLEHLEGVPRPSSTTTSPVICPRFRFGETVVRTFTTVVRFEHAHDVTISELRVELIFPLDDTSDAFLRQMAASVN